MWSVFIEDFLNAQDRNQFFFLGGCRCENSQISGRRLTRMRMFVGVGKEGWEANEQKDPREAYKITKSSR